MRTSAVATLGIIFGGIALVAIMFVGMVFGTYNSAVGLRNTALTQRAQIETQMQRRADLIPNLVASTKGSMSQEQAVFENISKAHAAFTQAPSGTSDKMAAGDALTTAIRGYMVVAQQYPNLKSLDIVVMLNDEMSGTENRVGVARQDYNEAVQQYNTRIQSLPLSLFASSAGFTPMTQFEASQRAQDAPVVDFGEFKE